MVTNDWKQSYFTTWLLFSIERTDSVSSFYFVSSSSPVAIEAIIANGAEPKLNETIPILTNQPSILHAAQRI